MQLQFDFVLTVPDSLTDRYGVRTRNETVTGKCSVFCVQLYSNSISVHMFSYGFVLFELS